MGFLQLYRLDAALIAFFSYIVGNHVGGELSILSVVIAFFISAFSMNFVYSFNSWADWKIDKINKPSRPLPAGRLKPRSALVYSLILFTVSIVVPFFINRDRITLFLFLFV